MTPLGLFSRWVARADEPPLFSTESRRDSVTFKLNNPQRNRQAGEETTVASVTLDKVPAAQPFSFIGSQARECLYGSRATGLFALDHKLSILTRTAAGTTFSGTAIRQGDVLTSTLMCSHAFAKQGLTTTAILGSAGSVDLDVIRTVAPGVRLTLSSSLAPGPITKEGALGGRVGLEYGDKYVHVKASHTVHKQPIINMSVATGTPQLQIGADLEFSTARAWEAARDAAALAAAQQPTGGTYPAGTTTSTTPTPGGGGSSGMTPAGRGVTSHPVPPSPRAAIDTAALLGGLARWTAAAGWTYKGHQLAVHVSDAGTAPVTLTTKLSYSAIVREGVTAGVEASRPLPLQATKIPIPQPVQLAVGVSARWSSLAEAAQNVVDDLKSAAEDDRDKGRGRDREPLGGEHDSGAPRSDAALVKFKLENNGMVSLMYSDRLMVLGNTTGSPIVQMTWAAQLNTLAPFARAPRVGVSLEIV